jgi:16S rRNA (cytidine1402-2'-O)-methyltransferase
MTRTSESSLPPGLYLVATPIGNLGDISLRALETLRKADIIACEDTREAGKLASAYDIRGERMPYHDHNADAMRPRVIGLLKAGRSVALISDAGMPLISDPGYKLVRDCLAEDLYVTCIPGASASLVALVLSGLPSDRFMFAGFLPPKSAARRTALAALKSVPSTLIFYETAPRLAESLKDMAEILGDRSAAVARELTKKFEETRRAALPELAAHYEAGGPPKGEIVVVVGPPAQDAAENWNDAALDAALRAAMDEEGMSVKDAAAFVASKSGVKKSLVYQRALLLRNRK